MRTKEITVGYKVAIKKYNDTIYSYNFVKTVELDKKEDEDKIKASLWDEAVSEIENQIKLT